MPTRTNLGKVRMRHMGTYNAATTYCLLQTVNYNGCSYIYVANTPSAGNTPPNTAYWQLLADNSAAQEAATAANSAAGAANAAASGVANAVAAQIAELTDADASMAEVADARLGNTTVGQFNRATRATLAPKYLRYEGKIYSASFSAYATSMASAGTREDDAVGLVANVSTDSVRGVNDFDSRSPFNIMRCNGYVDPSGEPVVTCFEGEPNFKLDGSNGDVWAYGVTPWFKIAQNADGSVKYSVSDTPHGAGWFPNPGSIRTDGSVRPFVFTACYRASLGSDGKVASISGKSPMYNVSHNSQLTACRSKGTQYCGYTSKDNFYLQTLFIIEFATLNCQSVMAGDSDHYQSFAAAVTETGVKRIIITNAQAVNFYVGECVSIGYPSALSSGNLSIDRGVATMHSKANRVRITAIDALEGGINTAITVDANDTFDTTNTSVTISGTGYSAPCYISTMPNYTGITDGVLGPSGSMRSNANNKNDCRYRYVENPYGSQYLPFADLIKNYPNVHVCYDCEDFATSVTSDYVQVGYTLSDHTGWQYVTVLGFDAANPSVRLATLCTASSTTRYGDGQYEDKIVGDREVLGCGNLRDGGGVGFCCAGLNYGLGNGRWHCGLRLSATGRCGRVANAA